MDVAENLFVVVSFRERLEVVEQSAKEGGVKPPQASGKEREPRARCP